MLFGLKIDVWLKNSKIDQRTNHTVVITPFSSIFLDLNNLQRQQGPNAHFHPSSAPERKLNTPCNYRKRFTVV